MPRDLQKQFEKYRDATVLITGGAGFIGSHLAHRLLELGATVRVIDDLSGGRAENLPKGGPRGGGVDFRHSSILDKNELKAAVKGCTHVFHEAAMVSVPQSVEQPGRCMDVNVGGTERVLSASVDAGVKRVVFAASAAAYGNEPRLPSKETDLPDCWSPYAMSKVAGEHLLTTFARCYGISTMSLRYFNVFGPRQDPKSPYAAVISAFADSLMSGRAPKVFGDGEQTRDFVPVENVVYANLLAGSCEKRLAGEVVNIGCGGRIRLLDVLSEMGKVLNVPVNPEFHPPRAGDVRHSCADISKARGLLGYEPISDFASGIRITLEWAQAEASARAAR